MSGFQLTLSSYCAENLKSLLDSNIQNWTLVENVCQPEGLSEFGTLNYWMVCGHILNQPDTNSFESTTAFIGEYCLGLGNDIAIENTAIKLAHFVLDPSYSQTE